MRAALASVLVLGGCLYNDPGPGGGGPVAPDLVGEGYASALCAKLFECCDALELDEMGLGTATEDECRTQYAQLFSQLLEPVLLDSIDAGRVVYDAAAGGACIGAINALSCPELSEVMSNDGPFEACTDPFDPQVANDGQCANDFDCTSTYCSGDSVDFSGNITYGTCIAAPGLDDPCDGSACANGFYCDFATITCQSPLANGSSCGSDEQCASDHCDDSTFLCADNMTCDGV